MKKRKVKKEIKTIFILLLVLIVLLIGIYFIMKNKIYEKNTNSQVNDEFNDNNIVDTQSPIITFNKELETTVGEEIDLLDGVYAVDNIDENIIVTVEGDYDFNTAKVYNLYYVAKDKANNETKEEFILTIKEKANQTSAVNNEKEEENLENSTSTTSKGFKIETKNGITYIDGILVVNKTYSLPSSYNPGFNSEVENKANEMFAAAKLDGLSLYIGSGFRSYSKQEQLYNRYVSQRGKEAADTFSARAGHSEHQSGLAFDVCERNTSACINSDFDNTPAAKWLANNAYKYGFILRFVNGKTNETGYKYESWHFRYVGNELAEKLYNNGDWITLEDYFGIDSVYK